MQNLKRLYGSSFYINNQLYDLLYFCSGRPKIDRKLDFQLYDLVYFCSGTLKIDRKVDFYEYILLFHEVASRKLVNLCFDVMLRMYIKVKMSQQTSLTRKDKHSHV